MPSIRWLPSSWRSSSQSASVSSLTFLRRVLLQRRALDPVGEDRPERDQVGVDAGVRLGVGVRRPEQLARVLGGERLDGVDVLAAGVEAVADRALGVLVGEPGAHRQQHRRRGVVLAGDQLERGALVGELGACGLGDHGARPTRSPRGPSRRRCWRSSRGSPGRKKGPRDVWAAFDSVMVTSLSPRATREGQSRLICMSFFPDIRTEVDSSKALSIVVRKDDNEYIMLLQLP